MITKNYKKSKDEVLSVYSSFEKAMKEIGKEVDPSIAAQAKKIKNEVFNLLVLGEAKSGKSTFINSYLGREVVPMDVRQCTSAIIKIKRGDDFVLTAKTAGGGSIKRTGEKDIQQFLKDNAALADEYRDIPIIYINNELLIKKRGNIGDYDIKKTIEAVQSDNINHLSQDEYAKKITAYIKENKNKWSQIITEIEIVYPLAESMKGITIIDSPGVSASGEVGKITEDYIDEANAIIFVKYLKGQALESASFRHLIESCTKQNKEMMFLLFNGKSDLSPIDFESLQQQAHDMYDNIISPEKILFVDSKINLILNKCMELGTAEKIDDYFTQNEEVLFPAAELQWIRSKNDVEVFRSKMDAISNFSAVQKAIEKFARVANYYQLAEFLDCLLKEYRRYKSSFASLLSIAEKNADDPKRLESEIVQKENEIADTYNKIKQGVDEIENKYTDNVFSEGIIYNEAEKMREEYKGNLENFKKLSSGKITNDTFKKLKAMTFDKMNEAREFRRKIAEDVVKECNAELIQYLKDSSDVAADAFTPNFTEADFEAIEKEAYNKGEKERTRSAGSFGLREERVPYHDSRAQVKAEVSSIEQHLDQIIDDMIDNVVDYTKKCTAMYKDKLHSHMNELRGELEKLKSDKENNDKILQHIQMYKNQITFIDKESSSIDTLKGEIEGYVKQ